MSSLLTNTSALAALQTLRSINSGLQDTQSRVASGLKVEKAADNAAYWSIATTMRSDRSSVSALQDSLGLAAAKVDTTYEGLESVVDVLGQFKAKLVAAEEDGVDKSKIQGDLDQLKQQVVSISHAASFNGQNWLRADIEDIKDNELDITKVSTAFVRSETGDVSVQTTDVHLGEIALFNSTGGGLLEADSRKMLTLGGIRTYDTFMDTDGTIWMDTFNGISGVAGDVKFYFDGPLTFDDPADQISFDVTVDADNPANIDAPYNTGVTKPVTIDRSTVDGYKASLNGVISSYTDYMGLIGYALGQAGVTAYAHGYTQWDSDLDRTVPEPDAIGIRTSETSGLDGSYVEISNFSSNVGSGGLGNSFNWGTRSSGMNLNFDPFTLYKDGENADGVNVSFSFSVNGEPEKSYSFDRTYVNDLLGKDNGKVDTVDEMVTLLQSLMSSDWPDVIIEATDASNISVRSDKAVDRLAGRKTDIGFDNISVSIEPLSELNFMDVDIASNPDMVGVYTSYIELVTHDVTSAASILGSLQKGIEMQSDFAGKFMDTIDRGVGRLVDADMEEESSRLSAMQTRQQLAIQSLSIANSAPSSILSLFQ